MKVLKIKLLYCGLVFVALIITTLLFKISNTPKEYKNTFYSLKYREKYFYGYTHEPTVCTSRAYYAILLVTSYVGHVEVRSAHRRAMPEQFLNKLNTTRLFSLAKIPNSERYISQKSIDNEQKRFGDILQGDFMEHYRNLTYKHIMGLNWTSNNCHTKFIIKLDDDTVFVLEKLLEIINSKIYDNNPNLLLGFQLQDTLPRRDLQNKWHVSEKEFPGNTYPPYLSGWLYVTTPKIAKSLVDSAKLYPYFWIDDIFITGILAFDLNIELQDIRSKKIWLEHYEQLECCKRNMIDRNQYCQYFIGTNGGRNNLIFEFNKAWRHCQKRKCNKNLNYDERSDCILVDNNVDLHNGHSDIRKINIT